MRPIQSRWFLIAAIIAVATVAPFFASEYVTRLLAVAAISAIAVMGLNIVFGYAGLISLGDAAFIGMGSYTVAILTVRHGFNPWLASLVAIAITAGIAYLIGRVVLRLKGHYLALATLGLNVSFTIVASNWVALTGGNDGIASIPVLRFLSFDLTTERDFYWFTLAVLVLLAVTSQRIRLSHTGRSFIAVKDDELAASMTGIPVAKAKTAAFTLGAVYSAIAGCLFAFHVHFVSPEDFAYHHSITHLAMLIVGGEGTIVGAILGAVTVTMLPELLRDAGNAYLLIFGILVLLVLILLPKGLVGLAGKRRQKKTVETAHTVKVVEGQQ